MGDPHPDLSFLNDDTVQAVIEVVARKVTEQVIAEHIRSCPHGQKLAVRWAMLVGICVGAGAFGGGAGFALVKSFLGAG